MVAYVMDDDTTVKTENAVAIWDEYTFHHESIHFSAATGTSTDHQRLHRSSQGCYWIEYWSDGNTERHAKYISAIEAQRWLLNNQGMLPDDLKYVESRLSGY